MDLHERLSYLFGTEEYVDLRRQLILYREKVLNISDEDVQYICCGSLCEGVAFPPSDDDIMQYEKDHRVVKSYREVTQAGDLLMVPSEYSPGYCLLLDVKLSYPQNVIHVINGMPFVSSLQWKLEEIDEGEYIHGPCHSQLLGPYEYDLAHCIPCFFWPDVANEWVLRNRPNHWPPLELIQEIVTNGCHVVPIGDTDSPFSEHEWRISFSVAERTLMHSLNHTQFLTYNLIRLCLKKVIDREIPDVMCSYFMKTTIFYTSERMSTPANEVNDIEAHFKDCLSVLYDYVDHKYCPNYFIPEYNMLKRKVNQSNRDRLLTIIRTLYNIGIFESIRLCGESSCLNHHLPLHEIEYKLDNEFMHSAHVKFSMLFLKVCIVDQSIEEEAEDLVICKLVHPMQGFSPMLQNFIFGRGIIYCYYHIANYALSCKSMNRSIYRMHKTIDSLLRIGYKADLTTGKLTMATYMYIVGKTESALSHLRRMLSKYPPYTIDTTQSNIKKSCYMEVMCNKRYTMDYKIRHAHAPQYELHRGLLNANISPIRVWVFLSNFVTINPLTYAYFLESLCYIRLQKHTLLRKSTRCLVNDINDLKDDEEIVSAKLCIGIIKYEQGDNQSACRWLGSAYMMEDDFLPPSNEDLSRSFWTYIACMLNRRFRGDI